MVVFWLPHLGVVMAYSVQRTGMLLNISQFTRKALHNYFNSAEVAKPYCRCFRYCQKGSISVPHPPRAHPSFQAIVLIPNVQPSWGLNKMPRVQTDVFLFHSDWLELPSLPALCTFWYLLSEITPQQPVSGALAESHPAQVQSDSRPRSSMLSSGGSTFYISPISSSVPYRSQPPKQP